MKRLPHHETPSERKERDQFFPCMRVLVCANINVQKKSSKTSLEMPKIAAACTSVQRALHALILDDSDNNISVAGYLIQALYFFFLEEEEEVTGG